MSLKLKSLIVFANLPVFPARQDNLSETIVLMHVAKGTRDVSQQIIAAVMRGRCWRSIKGPRFKSCPTNEGQVTFPSDLLRQWCADLSRFRRKNEVPRDCSREFQNSRHRDQNYGHMAYKSFKQSTEIFGIYLPSYYYKALLSFSLSSQITKGLFLSRFSP